MFFAVYIALVCPYDLRRPGGVRSHIAGLGRALVDRGHRVDVVAPTDVATLDALPVVPCGRPRGFAWAGTQIDITWASRDEVRAVAARGFDVMHFHTIWNPAMPFQLAAAFRGPKVATFHDVPGPNTPRLAALAMTPAAALIRAVWISRTIAVSPVVSSYLGLDTHVVIPNGVSVPSPLAAEGDREAVLFVGRLEPRKGVTTLIEAAAALAADCPPVWIAGDGRMRSNLQRRVAERGLRQVVFLGEIDDAEKWARLRRAALLVAPSTGGESFGIVLLEAMAAGAVPVASDIPGYRHVLAERADALLVAPGDAAALADRVRVLLRERARRDRLRAWGDAHWPQFAWPSLAARVEDVYAAALGRTRSTNTTRRTG